MVSALLNLHHGPHLVCMINQSLRNKRNVSKSSKVIFVLLLFKFFLHILTTIHISCFDEQTNAIALITDALQTNLQAAKGIESIDLPPLLRACETLGQFLVHR
jgi:hypothetical protein